MDVNSHGNAQQVCHSWYLQVVVLDHLNFKQKIQNKSRGPPLNEEGGFASRSNNANPSNHNKRKREDLKIEPPSKKRKMDKEENDEGDEYIEVDDTKMNQWMNKSINVFTATPSNIWTDTEYCR